jgi:type 1 fimbria pilin
VAFELNKPIPISLTNPPRLEAVPVKRPGATLKEGPFEATATLKAVYQ